MYTSRQGEELAFEHVWVFDGINTIGEVNVIVRERAHGNHMFSAVVRSWTCG
jgi:hypothetical protein